MERVVVIGNSGGGKSVLARRMADRKGLPYRELDALLWRPGWVLTPAAEYHAVHSQWITEPRWVIDGLGRRESIADRLARATDIVLVDLPLWVHFQWAAERQIAWATGHLQQPPGGAQAMPPIAALFRTIWEVDHEWMPELRATVAAESHRDKIVVHLQSPQALDHFADRL